MSQHLFTGDDDTGKYRCLWCTNEDESPIFHDLRVWYKIVGESGWEYAYCGMCEGCVRSEWKEYKNDFKDQELQPEVERRAYEAWQPWLESKVDKLRLKAGIQEELKLVYAGSGGKDKLIRKLRLQYRSKSGFQ